MKKFILIYLLLINSVFAFEETKDDVLNTRFNDVFDREVSALLKVLKCTQQGATIVCGVHFPETVNLDIMQNTGAISRSATPKSWYCFDIRKAESTLTDFFPSDRYESVYDAFDPLKIFFKLAGTDAEVPCNQVANLETVEECVREVRGTWQTMFTSAPLYEIEGHKNSGKRIPSGTCCGDPHPQSIKNENWGVVVQDDIEYEAYCP